MDSSLDAAVREFDQLGGPRGLPLIGNMLQIDPRRFHTLLEGWCAEYGSPYRFSLANQHAIVTARAAEIARLLKERPDVFRRVGWIEPTLREIGAHGVFSAEGAQWRRQRRLVMPAFDPVHLKSFFPSLVRVTRRLRDRWYRAAENQTPVDLQADLMRFTVDVTAGLAFGIDVNTIESEHDQIQQHLNCVFTEINRRGAMPFPYWRYFKLPRDRALDRHLVEVHKAIRSYTDQARARIEKNPALRSRPENLIEALLCARDEDGTILSDADVAGNVFTMLLAGEDTTANTLAWMIYLVNREPEAWRRVAAESDEVLGHHDVLEDIAGAAKLEFTDACINETMRLKPVAPVLALGTMRETVVEGVRVPANTGVFALTRVEGMKAANFSRPTAFDPTRWLAEREGRESAKKVLFPFGGGPRFCPGRYLAVLEMKMVMSMLSRNFRRPDVQAKDHREPAEIFNFTMMAEGLTMSVKPRLQGAVGV